MALVTHPYPQLVDPSNWCVSCHGHVADGMLCPVCLDDSAHGIELTAPVLLEDGRSSE